MSTSSSHCLGCHHIVLAIRCVASYATISVARRASEIASGTMCRYTLAICDEMVCRFVIDEAPVARMYLATRHCIGSSALRAFCVGNCARISNGGVARHAGRVENIWPKITSSRREIVALCSISWRPCVSLTVYTFVVSLSKP